MISPEVVKRALESIKRQADYEYFFDQLKSPAWIEPLRAEGLFTQPPEPIRQGDYVRIPVWPESRYLARVASQAPDLVLSVVLKIPSTDNIRVHEDLTDVALSIPAHLAGNWIRKELPWIRGLKRIDLLLAKKLQRLVAHLANGGKATPALNLALSVLQLLPDATEPDEKDEVPYVLSPRPEARLDQWQYGQFLAAIQPSLTVAAPWPFIDLLSDLLETFIKLSRRESGDPGPEDYSYIWRRRIRDHEHDDYGNHLATAVRDTIERVAISSPNQVGQLVDRLEAHPWKVFQRLALHLLRQFPEGNRELIVARLGDHARFDSCSLRAEYDALVIQTFHDLGPEVQNQILAWVAEYSALRQRDRLAPIRDVLPGAWQRHYAELVARHGPPQSYDEEGGWFGEASPTDSRSLSSMTISELVRYLRAWQPPKGDRWQDPTIQGLAQQLRQAIVTEPQRFAAAADQFRECDPTYIRSMLAAFGQILDSKPSLSWDRILELAKWIVSQPVPEETFQLTPETDEDRDPHWGWARSALADLLEQALKADLIPFDLRESVWSVLQPLTDDPEPTLEYELQGSGSSMSPITLSINSTRGKAMHATIRYALWVRRRSASAGDSGVGRPPDLDSMPEVREVLDAHLDPDRDSSLAIRAVYGQWFPWLQFLDESWARAELLRIFPADTGSLQAFWETAWVTYVSSCTPYEAVVALLEEQYAKAIERVGHWTQRAVGDPDEHLAEHLMSLYWRGRFTPNDTNSLLERFYSKAEIGLRRHALDFVGRSLNQNDSNDDTTPPEIIGRLQALWEWRLQTVKSSPTPQEQALELVDFGWWFCAKGVDTDWAIAQLQSVLSLAKRVEPDHLVMSRLAELAPAIPGAAVECLRLMIAGDREGYNVYAWPEEAYTILETAITSQDDQAREAAVDLAHRLGALGHRRFRELVRGFPTPSATQP